MFLCVFCSCIDSGLKKSSYCVILLQDRRKRVKGRGTSLGRQLVKGVGRRNSKRVVYLGWEAIFNLKLVLNRLPTL